MSDPALLTYAFATYPNPIQTSTAQSPLNANINIGVISPGENIFCSEITVAVPVGTDASSFTQGNVDSSLNNTMWLPIDNDPDRRASLNIASDDYIVTFVCKDQSAWLINYNLVLGLAAQVNTVVGNFTVKVIEKSGTSSDNMTYKAPTLCTLSKETPRFYLQNLGATAVGSPSIPATEFMSGLPFTLTWESNGTFFQIYEKGNPTPIYAGMQPTCTIQSGVQTDTTFFLVAMMTSNPTGDNPPPSYAPIYLYDALTVTVTNPNLTPTSVTASGKITGTSLNINGSSTLNGPTTIGGAGASDPLVVNLATELKATLQVDGNATLANLTVPGTSNLQGQTNLASVKISGPVNVNGPPNGGLVIWGADPANTPNPSHFDAKDGFLYMGWMPVVDEGPITFKLSDGSGKLGYNGSSRRFKDDIQDFSDDFHKILKAQPVSFVFKGNEDAKRTIGYIAEDFHDLGLHSLLVYNKEGQPEVIKYDRVALYQLEIIKELIHDVESLKERLNAGSKQENKTKSSAA
jgi:Chaperone of endosialidase